MLYIITALKSEAQAFVDKYKLQKSRLNGYLLFSDSSMRVIVSGIGVDNSMLGTQTLINHYDITDDDIYINVGICGANRNYEIGELIEIGAINFEGTLTSTQNKSTKVLTCLNEEATTHTYEIVDMESYGFYDAVIHSPAIKQFHILKIVSDHFEPDKITKQNTKSLLFNAINAINIIIKKEGIS